MLRYFCTDINNSLHFDKKIYTNNSLHLTWQYAWTLSMEALSVAINAHKSSKNTKPRIHSVISTEIKGVPYALWAV